MQMFASLGYQVDHAYVQQALSMFGTSTPGFLTPNEFSVLAKEIQIEDQLLALYTPPVPGPSDDLPRGSVFDRFDLDGDGRLSEYEIEQMLVSLNYAIDGAYVQEVMRLFGSLDKDQSGFIERDEFAALAAQLNIEATLDVLDSQQVAEGASSAETESETERQNYDICATRLQASWRGRSVRKQLVVNGAPTQAAAATRLQATWRGRSVRKRLAKPRRFSTSRPRSEAAAALLDKLVALELDEYHERLHKIGVKRVHDLALVTDQELHDIGMNKYDRAALLSVRAELQVLAGRDSRFMGATPISSSSYGVSFPDVADEARSRWLEQATQTFIQFSVTSEDGRPSLTREGWEAMVQSRAANYSSRAF